MAIIKAKMERTLGHKGWRVYICAVETALVEEQEGERYRVMEYSTPIENQPTTLSNMFVRKRDAETLATEVNSQRNGLLYHLKVGERRRGPLWSGSDRGYRAEARRTQ